MDRQCPLFMKQIFDLLDKDGSGDVNKREFIVALRRSPVVRQYFGLERVKQEDGTRDAFEAFWRSVDRDNSRTISLAEMQQFWATHPEFGLAHARAEQAKRAPAAAAQRTSASEATRS